MKKKLAVIGASYLQLPLVLKAKAMDLEVHAFAWEDGAVCKDYVDFFYPVSVLDKEKILEICEQVKIHGVSSIASDIAVPTVNYIADKLGLIGNSFHASKGFTHKYAMREILKKSDVTCPFFLLSKGKVDFEKLKFPVIVKPTDRSGSRGVSRVDDLSNLFEAIELAEKESFCNQAIIEEYITGQEVSVEAISWKGKHHVLAITDKVTTNEPYFVELAHHQPTLFSKEVQDRLKSETAKALDALNFQNGASHSEFIVTPTGALYAVEIGARMGGDFIGSDLVQLSTGYDYLSATICLALGSFDEPKIENISCSGIYFLCAETAFILPIITNATRNPALIKSEIIHENLHPVKCSADRSGYFIYQSDKRWNIDLKTR